MIFMRNAKSVGSTFEGQSARRKRPRAVIRSTIIYVLIANFSATHYPIAAFITRSQQSHQNNFLKKESVLSAFDSHGDPTFDKEDVTKLMELALAAAIPQALKAFVELNVADILGGACNRTLSVNELAFEIRRKSEIAPHMNSDALSCTLRILSSCGILEETYNRRNEFEYGLTGTGSLLQTKSKSSLAPMIQYIVDEPLWNSWKLLPSYISGQDSRTPFDAANGMSTQEYYSKAENAESLRHANDFVSFISRAEVHACVDGIDWRTFNDKTVIDLGGCSGQVLEEVAAAYPRLHCICLDLPQVVTEITKDSKQRVHFVGGDMFIPSTIPPCDAIFMKHIVLCEFDIDESLQILQSCHAVLPPGGHVFIAESVLPDPGQPEGKDLSLYVDYLMMLDGRKASYTSSQWTSIVSSAGFALDTIVNTAVPTCSIITLKKI